MLLIFFVFLALTGAPNLVYTPSGKVTRSRVADTMVILRNANKILTNDLNSRKYRFSNLMETYCY